MAEQEPIEFDCELTNETPKAYKVKIFVTAKKSKELWLPKSQVELVANRKGSKVTVPHWLAEKDGLL